ncbi:formate hydrogenlyase subunit 3/multisubunit Na+/H+ antiporter MnhD subunit [Sedimentibacter acidaminivorans]|uniref:Formate hydrogenlyase subunit 3/multisubunit Na+/H+ antiporter MnhD subunit n=1 Tax=Sedimentibacter acidaminivorans TaxID=913099 RepID=A0ABS4GE83_9FIRM|nr:proton-conducting transporter membrane subunit [Sedimentibacter acidaminivorans]MBP1926006.1 formate hydrogenlyase subunit 3/multisubunit Na+/H+ antiporter MnhD subunit [Sedimentibacter acidaminivorans]
MNPQIILVFIILIPLIGSFISFIIGIKDEKARSVFNITMTGANFFIITSLYFNVMNGTVDIFIPNIMGTGLFLKLDMFRYIFVWLTSLIWFLITIYSTQYLLSYKNRNRYYLFFMTTYWSTLGIFLSNNLINLFTFFEIMSLSSYPLIIHDEDKYSHDAGKTYLIMAVSGGLVLLMGLFLLYDFTQTLDIDKIKYVIQDIGNIKYAIAGLIIAGFGVKAGMYPLHLWLPKAHPASPAPASAILSGVLLKTGIFGILVTSEIMGFSDIYISNTLIVLGFITMFLGGFLAMYQRNIKRILAYSSMSQMGYIIVGIGLMGILHEHKAIALYGTIYHIINHMIFKVLLFMSAGVIYMKLHELSINGIGGFGRKRKTLKICFFIGSCAIMGVPGFNGFISKNLLHHALAEAVHLYGGIWLYIGELIFVISSAFTTAYLLKLFIAVFVEKSDHDIENIKMKVTGRALIPMTILAAMIIFIGLNPNFTMNIIYKAAESFYIYDKIDTHFYNLENIKSSLLSISLGTLIYVFFIRRVLKKGSGENWWYENTALNWFSLENDLFIPIFTVIFKISSVVLKFCDVGLLKLITLISNCMNSLLKMPLYYKRKSKALFSRKVNIINDINDYTFEYPTDITYEAKKARYKMNSITYSIYIFGVVLVLCLVVLLYS